MHLMQTWSGHTRFAARQTGWHDHCFVVRRRACRGKGLFPDPLGLGPHHDSIKRVRPPGNTPRPSADTRFFFACGAGFSCPVAGQSLPHNAFFPTSSNCTPKATSAKIYVGWFVEGVEFGSGRRCATSERPTSVALHLLAGTLRPLSMGPGKINRRVACPNHRR